MILGDDDEGQYRQRQARRAALAGLLLFAPWKKLRPQITMAAHDIDDYFDAMDLALDSGAKLTTAMRTGSSIVPTLTRMIEAAMLGGFNDGGALVGRQAGSGFIRRAHADALSRATDVVGKMNDTTLKWIKADPHNKFALSQDRAERAAKYEAAQAYYTGLQRVLWGQGFTKSWVTTSESPCDDCLENEDEGAIPIESDFPSGDYAPLAHINCQCVLEVRGPGES